MSAKKICSPPSSHLATNTVQRLSIFDRQYPVSRAQAPTAPIVLQNLPLVPIHDCATSSSCNSSAVKDCIICNEVITTTAVRLPCSHMYHPHCLTPWLQAHDTCPLCRCSLPTLGHFTTPRAQLPPPHRHETLRPPAYPRSELSHMKLTALRALYQSWVICTYHHQQLPMNLPPDVMDDREALISHMAVRGVIRILPEETCPTQVEQ
jgi:Ring finger domain